METTINQNQNKADTLVEDIHTFTSKKDINGIISVLDRISSRSEYEQLCTNFFRKYNYSFYNRIWNFIESNDYERLNLAMRKALC